MRLLVLTNLYPPHHIGGYELICETVAESLEDRGHEILILTSDHRCQPETGESGRGKQLAIRKPTSESEGRMAIERSLKINGLYGHKWNGIWRLAGMERHNNQILRAALGRFRPDLVYIWNMGGLSKSLLFALQASNIPTVFYISDHWLVRGLASDVWLKWWNDVNGSRIRRVLRRGCEAFSLRRRWQVLAATNPIQHLKFERIYFCSRALRDWTAAQGLRVEHGAVIYCPIHPRFISAAFHESQQTLKRLLYSGRLAEDKGVLTALRALVLLCGRLDLQLTVCGSGDRDYVARLTSFASKHKLPVTFTTAASDAMPALYRDHDALLFTSEWEEPFALTPLEAMACSLPVIGTTTGGSAELFRHGQNGLTYTAGHAEQLAERIWQFATDRDLRTRCARTAYLEAVDRYSVAVIVEQIEGYLEETLRTWRSPGLLDYHRSNSCKS